MRSFLALILFIGIIVFFTQISSAGTVDFIAGTSSAALIEDGEYAGLYRYDIFIEWHIHRNINQINLFLGDDFEQAGNTIVFPDAAGSSTSIGNPGNPFAMNWTGIYVANEDGSLFNGEAYIKYTRPFTPRGERPGKIGMGTFSFYSDLIPQYGLYPDILVVQKRNRYQIDGDLSGAYPHHTANPEPATLVLLASGCLMLLARKKR